MADMLRNSASMRSALLQGLDLVLPAALKPLCLELLESSCTIEPSPSTISRFRFILDGSFMLCQRDLFEQTLMNAKTGFVTYAMSDSSMQHGRDFEHIYLLIIFKADLLKITRLANQLIHLRLLGCRCSLFIFFVLCKHEPATLRKNPIPVQTPNKTIFFHLFEYINYRKLIWEIFTCR